MPGPRRRDRRTASSRDPVEVRRLLQRDGHTLVAVEGRAEASDCAAAESGQSREGAARRWTASRIPAAGGMRPIGRISGRHKCRPDRAATPLLHDSDIEFWNRLVTNPNPGSCGLKKRYHAAPTDLSAAAGGPGDRIAASGPAPGALGRGAGARRGVRLDSPPVILQEM